MATPRLFQTIYQQPQQSVNANMSTPAGPVFVPPPTVQTETPRASSVYQKAPQQTAAPVAPVAGARPTVADALAGQGAGGVGAFVNPQADTQQPAAVPAQPMSTPIAAPSSVFDLYGMEKSQQPKTNDVYSMYGLEAPSKKAANTKALDAQINELKPTGDTSRIQQMLQTQLDEIAARYGVRRASAERDSFSDLQSSVSGLYNAGVVNPLSSGVGSIKDKSDRMKNQIMAQIDAEEGAEKMAAINRAYGLETTAQDKALTFAQEERARLEKQSEEEYAMDRQKMNDQIDMINGVVSAWRDGQKLSQENKQAAQKNMFDILENFGSSAFDGMDEKVISDMESAAGYPSGMLLKGITQLKKNELMGADMNLRSIGGSLYNIIRDADGNIKSELIVAGKSGAGSGSKGKAVDKFEVWLQKKEAKDSITYNIGDRAIMDDLLNQYEYETGVAPETIIDKAMKDRNRDTSKDFTYEIRDIDGQPFQLKKDRTGRVIDKFPLSVGVDGAQSGSTGSEYDAEVDDLLK